MAQMEQMMLAQPTNLSSELFQASFSLLQAHYAWRRPLRSLGVRSGHLVEEKQADQMSLFLDAGRERRETLERTIDDIQENPGWRRYQRAAGQLPFAGIEGWNFIRIML